MDSWWRPTRLRLRLYACPTCGVHTPSTMLQDVEIVGAFMDLLFVHGRCPRCATEGLGVGLVDAARVSPAEVAAISPADTALFVADGQPVPVAVTATDVVAMQEFLQTFDGDFAAALRGGACHHEA